MEIFADALETFPGLTLVFAIAALFLLPDDHEIAEAIRVFLVAWVLYRISSFLDPIWDLVYGPGPRRDQPDESTLGARTRPLREAWCKLRKTVILGFQSLEHKRDNAKDALGERGTTLKGVRGLYAAAKKDLKGERWNEQVKPSLDYSKFFRAFVIPFFLISAVMASSNWVKAVPPSISGFGAHVGDLTLVRAFAEDITHAETRLEFFTQPFQPAICGLFCLLLYVWLRVRHMHKMFDLISPPPASSRPSTSPPSRSVQML